MTKKHSFLTAAGVMAAGAVLVLSGCSSHASTSSAAATPGTGQSQVPGQPGGAGFGGRNGTSGQIAAISGTTLQVQSTSDQTAVDYTSSTKITQSVSVSLAAVKVGECITATSLPASATSSSSSSSSSSSAAPSPSGAVTNVTITQPTNGSCTSGFGGGRAGNGGNGGASGTRPTNRPSFNPSDRPSNRPSGSRGGFGGGNFTAPTSGKVTAVSGSSITVDALDFQTRKTAPKTVTVTSATKYTETQAATSAALAVGKCVFALGPADDSGTVTATSIAVSSPVNGSCTTGFGGRGGFGSRGAAGSQGGTTNG